MTLVFQVRLFDHCLLLSAVSDKYIIYNIIKFKSSNLQSMSYTMYIAVFSIAGGMQQTLSKV